VIKSVTQFKEATIVEINFIVKNLKTMLIAPKDEII
jgi:hypothetical protein